MTALQVVILLFAGIVPLVTSSECAMEKSALGQYTLVPKTCTEFVGSSALRKLYDQAENDDEKATIREECFKLLTNRRGMEVLDFQRMKLTDNEVGQWLSAVRFNGKTLRALTLSENQMGDASMHRLTTIADDLIALKELNVANNCCCACSDWTAEGTASLAKAIGLLTGLTTLDVSQLSTVNPKSFTVLMGSIALQTELEKLSMMYIGLSGWATEVIGKALAGLKNLEALELKGNPFGDEGYAKIFDQGVSKIRNIVYMSTSTLGENATLALIDAITSFEEPRSKLFALAQLPDAAAKASDGAQQALKAQLAINQLPVSSQNAHYKPLIKIRDEKEKAAKEAEEAKEAKEAKETKEISRDEL